MEIAKMLCVGIVMRYDGNNDDDDADDDDIVKPLSRHPHGISFAFQGNCILEIETR